MKPTKQLFHGWLWLVLAFVASTSAQPKPASLPNLIVIATDDQRSDVIGALNRCVI